MAGDYEGARSYGITARRLNIFALVISLIVIAILLRYITNIVYIIQNIAKNIEF